MQYQKEYTYFNNLLSRYLKLSEGFTIKGEVQALSTELTNLSKQPSFLEIGMQSIFNQPIEKNRLLFITSLIKDKFKFDFELIDTHQLLHHYNKICETAYFIGTKYYSVYSNLSLAFAYIFIHISARSHQALESFLEPFTPTDPAKYHFFNYYFKILQLIVVEIDNPRLVIDQEHRDTARDKLIAQQYSILVKLNEITTAAWEVDCIDKENILQCFIEWVTLHYNPQVLNSIPQHYALNKLFQYVQDDNQTNVTAQTLQRLITHLAQPQEIPHLYQYLGIQMMELLSTVDQYSKNADLTEAEDYLRIIVEFCRKSTNTFVVNFDDRIYNFLKRLAKYTKDELVDAYSNLLQFWEEFILEAIQHKQTPSPQITALIEEVYDSICVQCHYSLKLILELNTRPQSRLYEFNRNGEDIYARRENSDTIFKRISSYFGKVEYLQMVYCKIEGISKQTEQFLWPYLQVYLFSLAQAMEEMQSNCKEVSNIISIYIQLSRKEDFTLPTLLRKAFLRIFKALMTVQQKDVEFIKLLFNLTSTCFDQPLLMPYAERTFEVGCEHNYAVMKGSFGDMVGLVQKYPNNQSIVKGIVHLLSHYQDLTQQYLPTILSYLFQLLQAATPTTPQNRLYHKQLMYSLISIIKVLQDTSPQKDNHISIITQFTRHIFPYVLTCLKSPKRANCDQDHEVERMVRLLKMIMRYIKFHFTEFIDPLYSTVLQSFAQYPICSYAYLVEIAITVFYSAAEYGQYFKGVYVGFCERLFVHMGRIKEMDEYCYLLDDFIGISRRFFLYNASIVLNSGQLPNIIDLCTTAFIGSNTPRIAKAAYNFFETIFMVYWREEFIEEHNAKVGEEKFSKKEENQSLYLQLKALLLQKLEQIVSRMLEHLSLVPQETTRQEILFTLFSEIKAFPQQNCALWGKILPLLPLDIMVANEKVRFMANLQLMRSSDFKVVSEGAKVIKRCFILMNKRMVNAKNRTLKF